MRRTPLLLAGGAAASLLLLVNSPVAVRPAAASPLPSPLPSPPVPLPSPPPAPLPTPASSAVGPVVSALPLQPLHPAPPAAGGDGAGAGPSGSGGSAAGTPPGYQPAPAEQAALPVEPQRLALEAQQAWLASTSQSVDEQDGGPAEAVGGGDGRFIWPITFSGAPPITQRFGCTDVAGEPYSPDCATHRFHTGIDLAAHTSTPVYAAEAGVAHVFPSASGYGNHVLIAHGNGWFTLYAHLSAFTVHDGDVVRRGDPLGLVGSTGFSTGPHLHFETRFGDHPLDPCLSLHC
jgi:murein DD-endopeptidase MepM/ murein hydrolase activator NlpD